ncbi:DUF6090 family protein [Formosa maritima]|uniref:Uncharacterized protein n=1 Tax=Formosa maritima TaxID=2592046 RepID=A0A5D0G359_9FLAO|nr:DUF6090 family protein [Formosa maritima]TYA53194.1 hypothetical protein FVF61_11120 [Formosa maritima]
MIKFFRHIRKSLLMENKTGKYFKYAVGEIVLVVIGILIALQINTWNNNRIEKEAEIKTLIELKNGIERDSKLMQNSLAIISQCVDRMKELKGLLKDKDYNYSQQLDTLFGAVYGVHSIRINKAFYEDLKASSLRLIKNDDIRLKIVNLFEDNYVLLDNIFAMELHINDITRPYYLKNFNNIDFLISASPNNFNELWIDTYYKNIVHYRIINLESNHIDAYNKTIPKIESLSNDINNYLKNYND